MRTILAAGLLAIGMMGSEVNAAPDAHESVGEPAAPRSCALGRTTFAPVDHGNAFAMRVRPAARGLAWELRAQGMATWVREVANLDPEVDPNHGWRHTFKSRATGLIDVRIRDHITGHGVGSVGRRYEHPEITSIAEALARFPRYKV